MDRNGGKTMSSEYSDPVTWTQNPLADALRAYAFGLTPHLGVARAALDWAVRQDAEVERVAAEVLTEARAKAKSVVRRSSSLERRLLEALEACADRLSADLEACDEGELRHPQMQAHAKAFARAERVIRKAKELRQ